MPPKVKPDDVIEAMLHPQAIDAICKAIMPMITLAVEEAIDKKNCELYSHFIPSSVKASIARSTALSSILPCVSARYSLAGPAPAVN